MTMTAAEVASRETEGVDSFRARAREWITANLEPKVEVTTEEDVSDEADAALWERHRELQRRLWAGGFAGICYPREYGGLGLTPAHQRAFNEEAEGFEVPVRLNTPSLTICAPTIMDMGTEEQKREFISGALSGEMILAQFLSEPTSGSDLAGARTRATRDGDVFVLSGSKIWSSGAYASDYALCLTRTDWDAPKHRGLTMFLLKIHQPGVNIHRIRQVDGRNEFCQEFFDDVEVPAANVVGEVNGGWAVASRQLYYERVAVGGGSQYATGEHAAPSGRDPLDQLIDVARAEGRSEDPYVRELIAEFAAMGTIHHQLVDRISAGLASGALPPTAGSIIRLLAGQNATRRAEIALEVAGPAAVVADPDADNTTALGTQYLMRQAGSLGGGSTEMARNIISERVAEMPREYAADRDVPFNQVRGGS